MKDLKNKSRKAVTALLMTLFVFACVESDTPEPKVITATFDKTEYYPFDAVVIQLPEKVTKQEYSGTLGNNPVTVVRMSDSTLVMLAPDLPAGVYPLTLPDGEKADARKIQGSLRIKPLPTVDNPEEVIGEIQTMFAQTTDDAKASKNPNAELLEGLAKLFNEELAKLSPSERKQFAAWWQAHPELNDVPDMELRISLGT